MVGADHVAPKLDLALKQCTRGLRRFLIIRIKIHDAVMTKVPMDHATPGLKAHLAEVILQAAAQGLTSYDALVAAGSDQIQTIISMLS